MIKSLRWSARVLVFFSTIWFIIATPLLAQSSTGGRSDEGRDYKGLAHSCDLYDNYGGSQSVTKERKRQ